jgi:hypothetical protein
MIKETTPHLLLLLSLTHKDWLVMLQRIKPLQIQSTLSLVIHLSFSFTA